jgi:signal transduction histidine kinase
LGVIEEEADRLTHLIENLLDASRLQAGGLKLSLDDVRLDQLAARLVNKFKTQIDTHELVVRFPDELPLVRGDEERLRQVLSNLISNAIKYSPEGGKITISGHGLPREVAITVSDKGPGLPIDEKERVFDRFYRAAAASQQGAGLGLFLARAIIEAHGGRIWVESELNQGSTFHFTLPRE